MPPSKEAYRSRVGWGNSAVHLRSPVLPSWQLLERPRQVHQSLRVGNDE